MLYPTVVGCKEQFHNICFDSIVVGEGGSFSMKWALDDSM